LSDEWLITVAAGLLVLHGGTFLLAQMLPPASWPVPALNGAVAGVVALFWLNRRLTIGHLPWIDNLILLAEGGVVLFSVLSLLGVLRARGLHWLVFSVHALLALALLGFLLSLRMMRLF